MTIRVARADDRRLRWRCNIMRKPQAHTIAELTKYAVREGLTSA